MKYLIILALFLISCTVVEQNTMYVCTCEEKKQVSNWITENLQKANNMSDEEMEDVISQLERTGVRLHCHQEVVTYKINGSTTVYNHLDSCRTYFNY